VIGGGSASTSSITSLIVRVVRSHRICSVPASIEDARTTRIARTSHSATVAGDAAMSSQRIGIGAITPITLGQRTVMRVFAMRASSKDSDISRLHLRGRR
jgi:hypothetical protein